MAEGAEGAENGGGRSKHNSAGGPCTIKFLDLNNFKPHYSLLQEPARLHVPPPLLGGPVLGLHLSCSSVRGITADATRR